MRILHVMAGNRHGGAETACIDMVLAMREAGQDVALVTRKNPRNARLIKADIPVYTLPFGGKVDLYTPFALKRVIKIFRPDIILTWMARAAAKTPPWSPRTGIPKYHIVSRLGGYYKPKYFKNTDYFTTITPDIKRHLVENGIEDTRVRHISNFAETENTAVPASRAAYNIPEDAVLLLGLGRLHTAKAFDVLIRAAAGLSDIYVWIAGEGPERHNLEKLVRELDLQERVKLLGWRDDRAALFKASDVCVFCSRYEPFGTVFVQAWAQETPVIVSDADGPRQFVRHEQDGLMVPVDDIGALKNAIMRLKDDPALRKKLIRNGRKRYEKEFTKEASVNAYLRYFEEIRKNG